MRRSPSVTEILAEDAIVTALIGAGIEGGSLLDALLAAGFRLERMASRRRADGRVSMRSSWCRREGSRRAVVRLVIVGPREAP